MVKARYKPPHKPPSRIRYEQAHPTVTVRVSKELHDKLKEYTETEGKSYADILKVALGVQKKSTDKAHDRGYKAGYAKGTAERQQKAYDQGYVNGLTEGRIVSFGHCSGCHKPLDWNLSNEKDVELLTKAVDQAHFHHVGCPDLS